LTAATIIDELALAYCVYPATVWAI